MMFTVNKNMVSACLKELSDVDFQRRVWVRGEGSEISSLTETMCELFDDSGLTLALDKGEGSVYDEEIDAALRRLGTMMDAVDTSADTEEIIESARWTRIVRLAEDTRQKIEAL